MALLVRGDLDYSAGLEEEVGYYEHLGSRLGFSEEVNGSRICIDDVSR